MPLRVVNKALADMLGILSHPMRIRIVEELREGERDVNSLQTSLAISHSNVSQHLALLRAQRIVAERREGRHVFYHLRQPRLARWLLDGIEFLGAAHEEAETVKHAIETVKADWNDQKAPSFPSRTGKR